MLRREVRAACSAYQTRIFNRVPLSASNLQTSLPQSSASQMCPLPSHPGILLKCRFWCRRSGMVWGSSDLTSSQAVLVLLVGKTRFKRLGVLIFTLISHRYLLTSLVPSSHSFWTCSIWSRAVPTFSWLIQLEAIMSGSALKCRHTWPIHSIVSC